ncbi:MAG: hypothetical protein U1A78_39110 [Polyangia bacterium]
MRAGADLVGQALLLVGWVGVLLGCGRLHRRLAGLVRLRTLDMLTGLLLTAERSLRQAKGQSRDREGTAASSGGERAADSSRADRMLPRTNPPSEQVARRLDELLGELGPLLPRHQFGVSTEGGLPRLLAEECDLAMTLLGLALYGACVSQRVRFAVSLVRPPIAEPEATQLVEIRLRLEDSSPPSEPSLLTLCLRACERCGAAWGYDGAGLYTLWPAVPPTSPWEVAAADALAAQHSGA